MRKLNRLIAAGALAVPMALGASGIAGAVESPTEGGLGEVLGSGDSEESDSDEGDSDEGSSAGDSLREGFLQAGRDARESGAGTRADLLESGRDARAAANESQDSSNDAQESGSASQESGNSSEGANNLLGTLEELDMGGSNFENNGGGLLPLS